MAAKKVKKIKKKTNRAAAKRFTLTGSGKVRRAKAHKISHRMSAMATGVERVMKAKGTRGLFP